MLRALFEAGVEPDVVVACSVGALNGAVIAAFPSLEGVQRLESIWRNIEEYGLLPNNFVGQAWNVARRRSHLHANTGLVRLVTSIVPATRFHDLAIPLRIVAADIDSGREVVFGAGPILRPMLATTALPGMFPPVPIAGRTYFDGGVVNNVPISHAVDADHVYVLRVEDRISNREPSTSIGLLMRGYQVARSTRFHVDVARYARETDLLVFPQPEIPSDLEFPDASRSDELIESGYEAARAFLAARAVQAETDGPALCEAAATTSVADSETSVRSHS